MGHLLKRRSFLAAGLLLALAGCGGGSSPSSSTASATSRGTATIVLVLPSKTSSPVSKAISRNKFPPIPLAPYAGNIPFGTNAVRVSLTNPTTGAQIAAPQLVTVPTSGVSLAPQLTVQFPNLPVGPVRVTTTAYADAQGTTPPLAVGTADTQIVANTTANVTISMALTVDHLVANTTVIGLNPLMPVPISVQAVDKNNNPLPFMVQFLAADPDIAAINQTGPNQATVASTTVSGPTQIIAYEPNSGLNIIIPVAFD